MWMLILGDIKPLYTVTRVLKFNPSSSLDANWPKLLDTESLMIVSDNYLLQSITDGGETWLWTMICIATYRSHLYITSARKCQIGDGFCLFNYTCC